MGKKINLPRSRSEAITVIRGLLNNAAVADNLHRFGFVDSPNCTCGEDRETVEHVLLSCSKYLVGRRKLFRKLEQIWNESRKSGNLNVTLGVILAPRHHHLLGSEEALAVEEAVWKFLSDSGISF